MVIAGAGGHALEVFDVLLTLDYKIDEIFFYDDYSNITEVNECKVLKNKQELKDHFSLNKDFCLGIGNPNLRNKMYRLMLEAGGKHISIISPLAFISKYAINKGADIMPFSFVSSKSKLGLGTLINTRVNIHHETVVGEFNEISPSANLLGQVKLGNLNTIGAGTVILPGIKMVNNNITGAGAVVTRDLNSDSVVIGVPAK